MPADIHEAFFPDPRGGHGLMQEQFLRGRWSAPPLPLARRMALQVECEHSFPQGRDTE